MGAHAALVALERAGLVGSESRRHRLRHRVEPVRREVGGRRRRRLRRRAGIGLGDRPRNGHPRRRAGLGAGAAAGRDRRARPDPRGRGRCARPASRATFPISPSAPVPSPSSSDGADGRSRGRVVPLLVVLERVAGGRAALRPALRRRALRSLRGRSGAGRGGTGRASSNERAAPDWLALHLGAADPDRMAKACEVPIDRVAGVDRFQRQGDTGCANATGNLVLALDARSSRRAHRRARLRRRCRDRGRRAASTVADGRAAAGLDARSPHRSSCRMCSSCATAAIWPAPRSRRPAPPFAASPAWERTKRFIGRAAGPAMR